MKAELRLFGSVTRTRLLVAMGLLETSYVSELARVLDAERVSIARMVDELLRDGVLVGRLIGKVRSLSLNPGFPGAGHLQALLEALARRDPALAAAAAALRRRPRRKGKPIGTSSS